CSRAGTSACSTTATRAPTTAASWSACRCRPATTPRSGAFWPSWATPGSRKPTTRPTGCSCSVESRLTQGGAGAWEQRAPRFDDEGAAGAKAGFGPAPGALSLMAVGAFQPRAGARSPDSAYCAGAAPGAGKACGCGDTAMPAGSVGGVGTTGAIGPARDVPGRPAG